MGVEGIVAFCGVVAAFRDEVASWIPMALSALVASSRFCSISRWLDLVGPALVKH